MHTMKMHTLAPCSVYQYVFFGKSVDLFFALYFSPRAPSGRGRRAPAAPARAARRRRRAAGAVLPECAVSERCVFPCLRIQYIFVSLSSINQNALQNSHGGLI